MTSRSIDPAISDREYLTHLSLEQLWQLFPIIVAQPNAEYKEWFQDEEADLSRLFGDKILRLSHIGSTAVPGLVAKPTVDILLELSSSAERVEETLSASGWVLMNSKKGQTFCKGYTREGFAERVFHLHVRPFGDWDELYFRDALLDSEDVRDSYADLKRQLSVDFTHDRDGYTDAKTEFVEAQSAAARLRFGGLYATAATPIEVAAVVFRRGEQVLTVRKASSLRFQLPGGKFEAGESPRQAAIRETVEEIGVSLDPDEIVSVGLFSADAANEPGQQVLSHVFASDRELADVVPQAEIAEVRWSSITDLAPDLAPLLKDRLFPYFGRVSSAQGNKG